MELASPGQVCIAGSSQKERRTSMGAKDASIDGDSKVRSGSDPFRGNDPADACQGWGGSGVAQSLDRPTAGGRGGFPNKTTGERHYPG
jgi:hypothetical protein